jgi:hypothetical protein
MAARLKVFSWSDGFHRWTVAASSRPKALQAWNADQDLFKTGLAHELTTGPSRDAALKAPGTVIRTEAEIDPALLKAPRPDPDRRRRRQVRDREAATRATIEALDAELAESLAPLRTQRRDLDQKIADLEASTAEQKAKLTKTRNTATARTKTN